MPEINPCEVFKHKWAEGYYGYECTECGQSFAYGCAPWEEDFEGLKPDLAEPEPEDD